MIKSKIKIMLYDNGHTIRERFLEVKRMIFFWNEGFICYFDFLGRSY
jgi:hypothetical protein